MRSFLLAATVLVLCGCQSGLGGDRGGLTDGTRRVVLNYLFAHGMAESYLESGHATRAGLGDLVRSDHAALAAIRNQASDPSWTALSQADSAVRRLVDVTSALDSVALSAGHTAASR